MMKLTVYAAEHKNFVQKNYESELFKNSSVFL